MQNGIMKTKNMEEIYGIMVNSYAEYKDNKSDRNTQIFGCYIKIKNDESNSLGKLGFALKKLVKKYDGQLEDEILNEIVFELLSYSYRLLLLSDKGNEFFNNNGLIRNKESICSILNDKTLSKELFNYLFTTSKFKLKKMIRDGEFELIDKRKHENTKEDKDIYIEMVYDDEVISNKNSKYQGQKTTDEFGQFDIKNLVDKSSLNLNEDELTLADYLFKIAPDILTKKQVEFLSNEEKYNKQEKYYYKKEIRKKFEKYLELDGMSGSDNYRFDYKKYIKKEVESKIEKNNEKNNDWNKINILSSLMRKDKKINNVVSDILISELENEYYRPIFEMVSGKIDTSFFMSKKARKVLELFNL